MAPARPKSKHPSRHNRPPTTPRGGQATAELDSASAAGSPLSRGRHMLPSECASNGGNSAPHNSLETLPVEVVNQILSYLVHPGSRLPGLTERQSKHKFPKKKQREIKEEEDMATPPDTERHFTDLFSWADIHHPLNVLASTSKRCRELVESYSAHLVKSCNMFNLPFAHMEAHGPQSTYPDLSHVVYRRLWLQTAPRFCVFCSANLSSYPHKATMKLLMTCEECFYAQTLTLQEIQRLYHIQDSSILAANRVRGSPNWEWVLRIDVEALALRMFGTRAFHSIHPDHDKKPCERCRAAGIADEASRKIPRRLAKLPSHVKRNTRPRRRSRELL